MFLNSTVAAHIQEHQLELRWVKLLYVCGFLVGGFIVTPAYLAYHLADGGRIGAGPFILGVALYGLSGLGITMGYHRLFAHRTFKTNRVIETLLLICGRMALQDTVLNWCAKHRDHHSFTDTGKDPYNATLGFLWSHMLWIFYAPADLPSRVRRTTDPEELARRFPHCVDLVQNPRVRRQHGYGVPVGNALTFAIPALFGLYFGEFWSYVLVAGVLRAAVIHQCTFAINSLAHMWGTQPYSTSTTATDSAWVAFITIGEGYHNYHHAYPTDYRNGAKVYHFDPAKWLVALMSSVGLTWDLRRANAR